jgi:uncharacterized protein YciI
MLYAIFSRFQPETGAALVPLRPAFNAHLMQDRLHIRLGGRARETKGLGDGIFLLIEAESADAVESFLAGDPYRHLYDSLTAVEIDLEIGRI